MTVEVLRNLRRSLIINSKAGIHSVLMNSVWLSTKELSVVKYSKLAKVTTFVTFRISSLWGSLLSWGHYYRGVITIGGVITFRSKKCYVELIHQILK